MAYWMWDPKYSVEIEVIDKQHKRIVEYINELSMAVTYNDKQKVETILFGLVDYTISHFSFEERLMEEAGYSMLEPHKQVHRAFIERIEFFKERFSSGEDITKQLMMELQMWLINHIKEEDSDYQQVVQELLEKKEANSYNSSSNNRWLKNLIGRFFK